MWDSELNKVVMDFLVQEGYPVAAARFAEEANMASNAENSLIEERVRIKNAIYSGDLQTAIEEINEIDVSVSLTMCTLNSFDKMILVFHAPLIALRSLDDSKHLTSVLSLINTPFTELATLLMLES